MHRRIEPSFFLTHNTGAPQRDTLGRKNPLSNRSCSCDLSSFSSAGGMRYRALEMGPVPGSSSIPKSTFRSGGIPGRSSGKTSINLFTMGTVSIGFSFPFVFTAQAKNAHPPCCTRRLAFIIDIIFGVVPVKVPLNLKVSPFGGVNITSFLWQSMLAKFSASQSIPSMTSTSIISTTFEVYVDGLSNYYHLSVFYPIFSH